MSDYHILINPELNPDCSGNYVLQEDLHGGQPWYLHANNLQIFFGIQPDTWAIGFNFFGVGPLWCRFDPNIEGDYIPIHDAAGIATVAAVLGGIAVLRNRMEKI